MSRKGQRHNEADSKRSARARLDPLRLPLGLIKGGPHAGAAFFIAPPLTLSCSPIMLLNQRAGLSPL